MAIGLAQSLVRDIVGVGIQDAPETRQKSKR